MDDLVNFKLLAEHKDNAAQYELGEKYLQGDGVEPSIAVALDWFEKSAKNGNKLAYYKLGNIYRLGNRIDKDLDYAFDLYLEGAKLGSSNSIYKLGLLCRKGEGTEVDFIESYKWYQISTLYGAVKIGEIGMKMVQREINQKQIDRAKNLAKNWIKNLANEGQFSAQLVLAEMYVKGKLVNEDPTEAYKWYYIASKFGAKNEANMFMKSLAYSLTKEEVLNSIEKAQIWLDTYNQD